MSISQGDGDLIAVIYDAIIDPSRWDEVVERIVEATKSFSGNLVLQQADAGSLTALYNVDPFYADTYAQIYHKNDPLTAPAWSIAPGELRACSYAQTDSFRASAYYVEFVRPQGGVDLVATGLVRAPMRSHFWPLQDRPMRFGWNRRNGASLKPSRRICSARPRSIACLPRREQQRTRPAIHCLHAELTPCIASANFREKQYAHFSCESPWLLRRCRTCDWHR
jgi:hypothetical protein